MGRKKFASCTKTTVEERVFQVSKGMGWKIAKRIWEPKQFHIVGGSRVRQRAAAC